MFEKLKQFKDLRDQAKMMQNLMAQVTEHHSIKGGKLAAVMDGNFKVLSVSIDPEYLAPEKKAELEAGLTELLSELTPKLQRAVALKMRSSGVSIPGLG